MESPPRERTLQIRCTKPDCERRFATVKEMRRHKKNDPDHFYCKTCNVDCEDYESLVQHKVDVMRPYIEGKVRARDVAPRHVVCEFCGLEFETLGGRIIHRERIHPADQDITCPGPECGKHFLRASHLIKHFENEDCCDLNSFQFAKLIMHKNIIRQILEDPSAFMYAIRARETEAEACLQQFLASDEDGGAPLPKIGDNSNVSTPSIRSKGRENDKTAIIRSVQKQGLANVSHSAFQSDIMDENEVTPWTQDTARHLFPNAKRKSSLVELDQQMTAADAPDLKQNMLAIRWWDPASSMFDLSLFYDKTVRQYQCPFKGCTRMYNFLNDFAEHILEWHARVNFACLCGKNFDAPSAMLAHTENAGSKCQAQKDPAYSKHLYVRTGGLLAAERIRQPELLSSQDLQVNVHGGGVVRSGVMHVKYDPTTIKW